MAQLGPMVVVADSPAGDLVDLLGDAGAFPIVESRFADAASAIAEIQPVALFMAEPSPQPEPRHLQSLLKAVETRGGPFMPVLARVDGPGMIPIPNALPIAIRETPGRLI